MSEIFYFNIKKLITSTITVMILFLLVLTGCSDNSLGNAQVDLDALSISDISAAKDTDIIGSELSKDSETDEIPSRQAFRQDSDGEFGNGSDDANDANESTSLTDLLKKSRRDKSSVPPPQIPN